MAEDNEVLLSLPVDEALLLVAFVQRLEVDHRLELANACEYAALHNLRGRIGVQRKVAELVWAPEFQTPMEGIARQAARASERMMKHLKEQGWPPEMLENYPGKASAEISLNELKIQVREGAGPEDFGSMLAALVEHLSKRLATETEFAPAHTKELVIHEMNKRLRGARDEP